VNLLKNYVFFFQGTSLLLPPAAPVALSELEIPLVHAEKFPSADIFSIPGGAQGGGFSGSISGVSVPAEASLPPSWQTVPVRQLLSALPVNLTEGTGPVNRLLQAFHVAQWRRESLFCGSCGAKNTDHPVELARLCPACGRVEYPRIAPAVITLITNDEEKVLLARNKKFTPGVYSLIAGFVEAGENFETAVIRETREEVGIEIGGIQYIASQPWPFPHSLMAGFSARCVSGTLKPDGVEIEDAQWFSRDSLPTLPGPGSLSRSLIERWLR
jgi:NAD+ diphosphatase